MQNNAIVLFVRFLVTDIVLDVVRFPVWWYTRGAAQVAGWYGQQLGFGIDRLALIVLLRNLGRPMFGDYTWQGRIISFFVRIVQLAVSIILFFGWMAWHTTVFLAYFALLPAVVWLLIVSFPNA